MISPSRTQTRKPHKPVVLILGAGASHPYGFPLGTELTKNIISGFNSRNGEWSEDVVATGLDWNAIYEFREHLDKSQKPSVDAFLANRPEFLEIGKTCIARALIPYETESSIKRENNRRGWYDYLFQHMRINKDDSGQNRISFITFNYDRSLEQFFFTAIKHTYGLSDDETATLVRAIKIVHPHGDLGKLPVLEKDGAGRPYEPTMSSVILKAAASRIKIVSDDFTNNADFKVAQALLHRAEKVCFLGFGYNEDTLKRLWPLRTNLPGILHGTALGIPQSDQTKVLQFLAGIQLRNCDALQMLHDIPIL